MQQHPEPILQQSFASLGFSADFLSVSRSHHYYTPAEMLQQPVARLEKLPGITQKMLFEFVGFLESHQLDHYLIDP